VVPTKRKNKLKGKRLKMQGKEKERKKGAPIAGTLHQEKGQIFHNMFNEEKPTSQGAEPYRSFGVGRGGGGGVMERDERLCRNTAGRFGVIFEIWRTT
jgi:hypothetical protein